MLQHKVSLNPGKDWRRLQAEAIRDPLELLDMLGLTHEMIQGHDVAAQQFPMRVPRGYVARMEYGNPLDPLLRQILPVADESSAAPGFLVDPVGDQHAVKQQGLLQKYQGRVLLMVSSACAIHCRYCFRRHFPYSEHSGRQGRWHGVIEQIAADPSIHEVILSGGDPLSLSDDSLGQLIQALSAIPQLKRLRIHTRHPVVLPERVTPQLLEQLQQCRLKTVCVIHCNHAKEIDSHVAEALAALHQTGTTLLNQAVLLRGVNDSSDALCQLSETLFEHRVLPYYLHLLDKVAGAAHFDLPESEALNLMTEIRRTLPGYLVPRLVREIAEAPFKIPITEHTTPSPF